MSSLHRAAVDNFVSFCNYVFDSLFDVGKSLKQTGIEFFIRFQSNDRFWTAVHGFASNLTPLIVGKSLLTDEEFQDISDKAMTTVVQTAVAENDLANWAAVYEPADPNKTPKLVQYCHGAPGMVTALAMLPKGINQKFDRILEQGGELTWQAGALKKGSNLCHGTGGNGYAFLKLFVRTEDQMWLDRARAFAMHSIEQYRLSQKLYGQLRYPLWTGDIGLAIYLWDCLEEQAKFPTIDIF